MGNNIMDAPHGMNLVVETKTGRVVIGRFDQSNGFEVLMHDCDVFEGEGDAQHWVRETATYGVDVKHRDYTFAAGEVSTWTPLGDIEKLA